MIRFITKQKKLKTILVGLGNVGFNYDKNNNKILTHSKAISKNTQLNFVCAVDKNKKKLIEFKKKYNIKISNNLKNSLKFYKPDLVIISVNTKNLYKVAKSIVIKNYIKFLIIEKPGGKNYSQLKKLYQIADKKKVKIYINYNRSYFKKFHDFFKVFKTNKNFKSVYFYNRGFLNNCSHFLNLIFFYLSQPKKIKILNKGKKFENDIQPDINLKFKNGEINLICNGNKNIMHNEFFFLSEKLKANSNSKFDEIKVMKLYRSKLIKNYKSYKKHKIIKLPYDKYQLSTNKEIIKRMLDNKKDKFKDANLKVLKLYQNVIKKINVR